MNQITKSFGTDKFVVNYPVEPDQDGQRLDQFLKVHFKSFSREFLKKKIQKKEVIISGRPSPHKASSKVYLGETITIFTYKQNFIGNEKWKGNLLQKEEDPKIIFEDNDIVIINKPAFMTTHPTGKHLFYCATVYLQNKYGHTIHSVHRLDRETSGTLVLAKNPKAANLVSSQFEFGDVRKCYFFIAKKNDRYKGQFPFWAKENLGKSIDHENRVLVEAFPEGGEHGKLSQTYFEYLAECAGYILGLAYPKTGRSHQIRVHAAHHGFPLLGDKLYNGDPDIFGRFKDDEVLDEDYQTLQIPRHALHAMAINFEYKDKRETFTSGFPTDLAHWIGANFPISLAELEKEATHKINQYFTFH